jgi:hypothetical protein
MDETANDRSSIGNEKMTNVRGRSRTLKGGHDPSELGRLSGTARREKARQRETDVELDKLALRARLAVIGAGKLDAAALQRVYDGLITRAQGDGHVANGAAKILLDLARATVDDVVRDTDATPLEEMSMEERAALYARVLAATEGDDAGDEVQPGDGDEADPGKAIPPSTGWSPHV